MAINSASSVLLSLVTGCTPEAPEEAINLSPKVERQGRGGEEIIGKELRRLFLYLEVELEKREAQSPRGKVIWDFSLAWAVLPVRFENLLCMQHFRQTSFLTVGVVLFLE